MKRVQLFFTIHLLIAVTALAIGYALGGRLAWAFGVVFVGGLWYTAQFRGAQGIETIIFFAFALAAAAGFWIGLPPIAMLLTMVAALGAWDLDHFSQRLRLVERVVMDNGLDNNHLRRLLLIELLGLMAGLAGLTSDLRLTFWNQVLLVILAVFGISRLVLYIKAELK
jgi:hypothetical protein